ncbi:MAG TPA: hypothetical protein VNN07_00910 [Candidatus Tectomicrobia bacterium]|nr:hypothetical protein [Candidatus Tectomicrobia bacterium]
MKTFVTLAIGAVTLAGCGAATRTAGSDEVMPAALVEQQDVAGRWTGTITETGAGFVQGQLPLDIRIAEDGTWSGTIGAAQASGVVRGAGDDIVLEGTTQPTPTAGSERPRLLR